MNNHPNFWAVIPAAGVGSRMASNTPKQYLSLHGKQVIEHTLSTLLSHSAITGAVVAISPEDEYWQHVHVNTDKAIIEAEGGSERCHSVFNALTTLAATADEQDWVLVHDAARPCLQHEDIDKLIAELADHEVGGILAIPVRDTMKRADNTQHIGTTEAREGLWHALTPQMFRLKSLMQALEQAIANGMIVTDESSAMEAQGLRPKLIEGRADNIKITRPEDLQLATFYLQHTD